ncbi:hypothetical protein D3C76_1373510 [compost metagenome]
MDAGVGIVQLVEQYPGGRQSGVAAEVHLAARGEPAQLNAAPVAHEKSGLRLVVLPRHIEQRLVRQPCRQRAHRRRVAAKRAFAERIDQIKLNLLHCFIHC